MLKNSDVKEMADRFGENYIDQDDIGYAGAKIAMKRYDVLSEKANCFFFLLVLLFWLTSNCIATCFCFLIFFYKSMHLQA